MAKKFPPGLCAHCANYFEDLTSDHVFPQSWYPDTTPDKMEKWQMPSCIKCNRRYSKIEDDLLVRLSLGLEQNDFHSIGVTDKAMRAMTPEFGRNKKDRHMRQKKREKILKQMISASQCNDKSFLSGLNNSFGMDKNQLFALLIPENSLEALGEKIVRGVTYVLKDKILDDNYIVEILIVQDNFNTQISEVIRKHTFIHHRGPGIIVGVATPNDNPDCGWFEILIWGKIKFYGAVLQNK
jgi:hypothetical protein